MSQSRKMLLAEIGRLEGMMRGRKSSEDLVEDLGIDTDMGEGAKEACDSASDFDEDDLGGFDDFADSVPVVNDDIVDDILGDEDFDGADVLDAFVASETSPGIEDEITTDKQDEVAEEVGADGIATEDSVSDVVASDYSSRLAEASRRLDRVASYLEKSGQVRLAYRIDRLADALDSEKSRL